MIPESAHEGSFGAGSLRDFLRFLKVIETTIDRQEDDERRNVSVRFPVWSALRKFK